VKLTTIITLTEEPLVRSWLFADKGELISQIAQKQKVILVCNKSDLINIQKFLIVSKIDPELVSVKSIEKYNDSVFHKFIGFLMRYSEKSDGNSRLRNLLYERKKITYIGLILRNLINILFSRLKVNAILLRFIYGLLPNKDYRNFLLANKCSFLFCTSLTNFNFDAELLRIAKQLKIENVGSPRSWDNLVSHGLLRVIPNIFFSHSRYMTDCALKYQYIQSSKIIETGTSTYRASFMPVENGKKFKANIAIGCVGPNSNPSEYEFISKFIPEALAIYPQLNFTVIQHPKFKHPTSFNLNKTSEVVFDFNGFQSLHSYYASLREFDLLLTCGSTIGLDALFVGTHVECYFIDLIETGFWESSSRFLTHRTHYKDFINKLNLVVHTSFDSIFNSIEKLANNHSELPLIPTYFTGYPTHDFDSIIINSIKIRA
jgi:hypothetical protein